MDAILHTLSKSRLFASLDDRALQEISLQVHERTFEPGQVIMLAHDPCGAVCLIGRGGVRVRRLSLEGREYVLNYLGPGEFFNLVPALDGKPNLATVEALAHTTLYVIPCDRFLRLVHDHKPVAMATLEHLAARIRYLSDRVEELALHTVRTRLARFLLDRADRGVHQLRQWTQEEIAAHIGTVRDVVGRTLRAFAREGMIRRERGRLVVTDRGGLQRVAMHDSPLTLHTRRRPEPQAGTVEGSEREGSGEGEP